MNQIVTTSSTVHNHCVIGNVNHSLPTISSFLQIQTSHKHNLIFLSLTDPAGSYKDLYCASLIITYSPSTLYLLS